MDEKLIKKIVKLKLEIAEKLMDRLPENISSETKDLGRTILKSIDENQEEDGYKKSKTANQLNHITIE